MVNLRIGNGFDVHQFVTGRDLVIGGKKIDYRFGLHGHSDADVLIHAVIDSLLGAAGLVDIGRMFPDSDSSYKNISSMVLLGKVRESLEAIPAAIINIDTIVICQEPKISPHIEDMRNNISSALRIDVTRINIKGKTTEGLGFTGRGEGIACYAVSLVQMGNTN
ncbi:MAG TPA: 2-C-methyl-D-erythritol 2,4-cyclodiphosphate synthase [Spirochaetota bacterium]|jgi:2-C-methyl-D-erythritol 2,4-cyclodiphosphate synthase|nr:2-C-methyl-D-erythritol 2,4-cyclodiphosphate synthase [Spirochaetota bacterium]HPV40646.1 2-C-methyl-D-erythritol 2,4-cyclodiphosphate synthase [Spirochaetota bacterium]